MTPGMSLNTELNSGNIQIRKTAVIDTELRRRNVHIAALQETRLPGAGTIREMNYTFFWFGKPENQARLYGTGFAVHNSMISSIQTPIAVNERISSLKLNTKQGIILVISTYAPTQKAESGDKDNFYERLEELIRSVDKKVRIVMLGDMNARVGNDCASWQGCLGKFGVGSMNDNGQRLLELCS